MGKSTLEAGARGCGVPTNRPAPIIDSDAKEHSVTDNFDSAADLASVPCKIAEMQEMARQYSSLLRLGEAAVARIAFVVGSPLPWRVVENEYFSTAGWVKRKRMLYFSGFDQLRRCLHERIEWRRADNRFADTYMATAGGLTGVTFDWVPTRCFDSVFGPAREAIRRDICLTSPNLIVNLI